MHKKMHHSLSIHHDHGSSSRYIHNTAAVTLPVCRASSQDHSTHFSQWPLHFLASFLAALPDALSSGSRLATQNSKYRAEVTQLIQELFDWLPPACCSVSTLMSSAGTPFGLLGMFGGGDFGLYCLAL